MAADWGSVVITDAPTPKMWTWPIEATLRSLLVYAPTFLVNALIIAFDGAETSLASGAEPRGHYGGKCAGAANLTAYASYKTRVKALVTDMLSTTHRVRFVEPLARQCLAGLLSLAMRHVVTKYVFVMQSDIPLTRAIDVSSLLGAMAARRVNVVWLAIGSNKCNTALAQRACRVNRPWVGPKSEAHDLLVTDEHPGMTAMSFWSDTNHVASASFYRDTVLPRIDEGKRQERLRAGGSLATLPRGSGFPEHFLFCEPWKNHSAWRTFLLGAPNDGNFSTHLDGRLAEGPGKPVQMHSCQGTRGVMQMGKSLQSPPHLIMGGARRA